MSETKARLKRSNYNGQEEMVSALWDFAADVIALGPDQSFSDRTGYFTAAQSQALRKAMKRIADGFGYRLLEIE